MRSKCWIWRAAFRLDLPRVFILNLQSDARRGPYAGVHDKPALSDQGYRKHFKIRMDLVGGNCAYCVSANISFAWQPMLQILHSDKILACEQASECFPSECCRMIQKRRREPVGIGYIFEYYKSDLRLLLFVSNFNTKSDEKGVIDQSYLLLL